MDGRSGADGAKAVVRQIGSAKQRSGTIGQANPMEGRSGADGAKAVMRQIGLAKQRSGMIAETHQQRSGMTAKKDR
jgi:hypothetical protein